MRVGIAHHLGWAVAVTADDEQRVVDRRRIELVAPDLPAAPVHHEGGPHDMHRSGPPLSDDELAALVARVRASVAACAASALATLAAELPGPVVSLSVRAWPDLPADIASLRRPPHESRADSAMYCELLAEAASARGWEVHLYEARTVESGLDPEVLAAPRAELGPPWTKDHRQALAATIRAALDPSGD